MSSIEISYVLLLTAYGLPNSSMLFLLDVLYLQALQLVSFLPCRNTVFCPGDLNTIILATLICCHVSTCYQAQMQFLCCRSWLITSRGVAKKIRNTNCSNRQISELGAEACRECPNCKHVIDNSDVSTCKLFCKENFSSLLFNAPLPYWMPASVRGILHRLLIHKSGVLTCISYSITDACKMQPISTCIR
jgi:hypothetical protein